MHLLPHSSPQVAEYRIISPTVGRIRENHKALNVKLRTMKKKNKRKLTF